MEKEQFADLHVHTYYSDSTFSPEEVVKLATHEGLSAISITDHDCLDGIPFCIDEGRHYGLEIIPGIELTVEKGGNEVHILGYFIDWEAEWFRKKISIIQKDRIVRMKKMIELLSKKGIDIALEDVLKISGKGSVGRLHLAMAMLKTEKIRTLQEAFSRYIGNLKSCYVSHIKFTPKEAFEIIYEAGGIPVLAHPNVMGKDEYIPDFVKQGLRGIEVYHSDHNYSVEKKYLRIAKKNNLLVTGGSDCHGYGKGCILLGRIKLGYPLVEKLKKEAEKIQQKRG